MTTTTPPRSASVEVLTAEVRVVMVGNRQITLSVYRQLDAAPLSEVEPWGRVRATSSESGIELIGRALTTGELVRCVVPAANARRIEVPLDMDFDKCFVFGPVRQGRWPGDRWPPVGSSELPTAPTFINVGSRGSISAYVEVPSRPPVDPSLPPGAIRFVDKDAEDAIRKWTEADLDEAEKAVDDFRLAQSLPLIVLAGLK